MKNQSKQMVIGALMNVINAAPILHSQRNYMNRQAYQISNWSNQELYPNNDISKLEFDTWIDYVNQILDISYNHIGLNDVLSTKMMICQLASQYGLSNMQRIDQTKQELIKLVQIILQY